MKKSNAGIYSEKSENGARIEFDWSVYRLLTGYVETEEDKEIANYFLMEASEDMEEGDQIFYELKVEEAFELLAIWNMGNCNEKSDGDRAILHEMIWKLKKNLEE